MIVCVRRLCVAIHACNGKHVSDSVWVVLLSQQQTLVVALRAHALIIVGFGAIGFSKNGIATAARARKSVQTVVLRCITWFHVAVLARAVVKIAEAV